jgi:hypothetical protein
LHGVWNCARFSVVMPGLAKIQFII